MLFAHPSVAAKNVPELMALAKAKPGAMNCASPGNATPNHLGCEMLKALGGVSFVHVPYKGTTPAGLTEHMRKESERWSRVIKMAGAKIER